MNVPLPKPGPLGLIQYCGADMLQYAAAENAALRARLEGAEVARAQDVNAALLEALIAMEREKSDYMVRNNLGDPAKEHTNKMARAAIEAAVRGKT